MISLQLVRIIVMLSITQMALGCSEGCLRCEKSKATSEAPDKCTICDWMNNYTQSTDQSKCEKSKIENCEFTSPLGIESSCLVCKPGMIFDSALKNCTKVPDNLAVENCYRYQGSELKCDICGRGHYVMNGKCLAVTEDTVPNCHRYESQSKCLVCNDGFFQRRGVCLKLPSIENCLIWSQYACETCMEGYLSSTQKNFNFSTHLPFIQDIASRSNSLKIFQSLGVEQICQKIELDECLKPATATECEICKVGYMLNAAKKCVLKPYPSISNCAIYFNLTVCLKCDFGFHLMSNQCRKSAERQHCKEYHIVLDQCGECEPNYYLSSSQCLDRVRSKKFIENCHELETESDECKTCKDTFQRVPDRTRCLPSIARCTTYQNIDLDETQHKCSGCEVLYYPSGDRHSCLKQNVNFCEVHLEQQNKCKMCKENFYILDGNCVQQSLPKCMSYILNYNKCSECQSLFYLDSENLCEAVPTDYKCKTSNGLNKECKTCLDGLVLNAITMKCETAVSINSKNSKIFGKSKRLKNQQNGNSKLEQMIIAKKSKTEKSDDGVLEKTFEAVTSIQCVISNQIYFSKSLFVESADQKKNLNCEIYDPDVLRCKQCIPGYEFDLALQCIRKEDHALYCGQIKEGDTTTKLSENKNCSRCSNPLRFRLQNGTCVKDDHTVKNCLKYNSDFTECDICNSGYMLRTDFQEFDYNNNSIQNTTTAGNGIMMVSLLDANVKICREGYVFVQSDNYCRQIDNITALSIYFFEDDVYYRPVQNEHFSDQANCFQEFRIYDQSDYQREQVFCTRCMNAHIPVISNTQNKFVNHVYNATSGIGEAYSAYVDCAVPHQQFSFNNIHYTDPELNVGVCGLGMRHETSGGVACIRCPSQRMGKVMNMTNLVTFGTLTSPVPMLVDCQTVSDLVEFNVAGLDYHRNGLWSKTKYSDFINGTKCSSGKYLVYFFGLDEWADLHHVEMRVYSVSVTDNSLMMQYKCEDESNRIPEKFRSKCQIFVSNRQNKDSYLSESEYKMLDATHCLACKPGYRAVVDASSQTITSCEEIRNCDTSIAGESSLNMCTKCLNGMVAMVNGRLDFTQCVDKTAINNLRDSKNQFTDNCYVADVSTNGKEFCRLCKEGYNLGYNGRCVSSLVPSCQNHSFGKMNTKDLKQDMTSIMTNSYLALKHKSKLIGFSSFCLDSSSGSQIIGFKDHGRGCFQIPNDLPFEFPYKCQAKNQVYDRFKNCSSCMAGYTLFTPKYNTHICVPQKEYSFENMKKVGHTNNTVSVTCEEGYVYLKDKCVEDNCQLRKGEYCALCQQGYVSINSLTFCVPNPDPLSSCLSYSPILGHCISCSQPKSQVIAFYQDDASSPQKFLSYVCSEPLNSVNISSFANEHSFFKYVFTPNGTNSQTVLSIDIVRHDGNTDRIRLPSGNVSSELGYCMNDPFPYKESEFPKIANCLIQRKDFCLGCHSGYALSTVNTCISTQSYTNCILFKNDSTCLKCVYGYHIKSSQCVSYMTPKCLEYNPETYECAVCEKDHYFTVSNQCEKTHSMGCERKNLNGTECLSCSSNFYLLKKEGSCDSDPKNCNQCMPRNANKYICGEYDETSNQCLSCQSGNYYLKKQKGQCSTANLEEGCNTCEARTRVDNCEEYDMYKDRCLACGSGFYKSNVSPKSCTRYKSLGCKERLFGVDACYECVSSKSDVNTVESSTQPGYFCPVKTPQNCKNFKNNKTQCKICKTGYILDETETTCLISYYDTCQTMSPDLKRCQTCRKDQYNTSTDGCKPYSPTLQCRLFSSNSNVCVSCDNQRRYIKNNICVEYQKTDNCLKYSSQGQFCEECFVNYRLDLETRKCVTKSQISCSGDNLVFNKDECLACDDYDEVYKPHSEAFCVSLSGSKDKCLHSVSREKCLKCQSSIGNSYFNAEKQICQTRSKQEGCSIYDFERDICLDCLTSQLQYINLETKACVTRINDSNCLSYESMFSSKCLKCQNYDNYYLDLSFGKCLQRSKITNCEEYQQATNTCKLCSKMFYWDGGKCAQRTYTYCESYEPYSDDCVKCNHAQFYYYDFGSRTCRFRDNYGLCVEYHYTKSECTKCNEQSHYLKNGICHKFVKLGCSGNNYNGVANQCLGCDDKNKFFYRANSKECVFRSRTDCLEFDPNSDNCESCNSTFYYLMQQQEICGSDQVGCKTCSVNYNSNCEVLDPFNNGCSVCREGMYLEMDGKQCHQSYGLDCLINQKVQTDCFDCLFNSRRFNPFSVQCSHRPMRCNHCYSYKSVNCAVRDYKNDKCLLCPSGHWLNETSGSCQMGTSNTNCKTHDPSNSKHCTSCNEPFFKLVIDPECSKHSSNCFNICVEKPNVKSQVPECLQNTAANLDCDVCYDGHYLTKTSGNCFSDPASCNTCSKYTVTGCKTYDKFENQCASCQGPYYELKASVGCTAGQKDCMRCVRKPTVGNLVQNCVNNTEESLDCLHCNSTSYLTKTSGTCYDDPPKCNTCTKYTIDNCLQYNLYKDQCTACDENKYNLKNDPSCSTSTEQCLRCVEKKKISEMVPACSRDNSNSLDCDACIFGYYMTITPNNCYSEPSSCNICRPYTLKNCKLYDQYKDQCLSCYTGLHYLKSGMTCSDGTSNDCKKCEPYTVGKCKTYKQFEDQCDSCISGYYGNIVTKKCTAFTAQNCKSFNQDSDNCTSCQAGFYLKNLFCSASTQVAQCAKYDGLVDKCEQCESGYYIDQSENKCKENPTGPINCIRFNVDKRCDKCSPNYFLTNDAKCQRVEKLISNCEHYSQDGVCSGCHSGFILSGTECQQAQVQNCIEYIDKSNCKTCKANYILDSSNSECIFSGIDFCEKATSGPTTLCEKCAEKYVLSTDFKKCLVLDEKTRILNCQVHSKERFCTSCVAGHYLVEGNYACRKFDTQNTSEPKCVSVKESDVPFCTFCQLGFYMNGNSGCVKCPQENCGICSETGCEMCVPGSYMNPELKCVGSEDGSIRTTDIQIENMVSLLFGLALILISRS